MVRKKGSPPGLLCLTIALCARRRINITNNFTQPYKDLKPTIDAHYILKIFWQVSDDSLPAPPPPSPSKN